MTDTTPRSALPLLAAAQAQKHVTHNEALLQLDALFFARFLDRGLSTPPASPSDGDTYLVHATATGDWTGQDGRIAYAVDGGWRFYAPFAGLAAYVVDEARLVVFDGTAWVDYASILDLANVPLLGVNTTADSTNKLAAKSDAVLFDNAGAGVQAKINKNAAGDTASLLYQRSYSGRAEVGLCGNDDFHFKTSPDGSAWREALTLAAATGRIGINTTQPVAPLELHADGSTPTASGLVGTYDFVISKESAAAGFGGVVVNSSSAFNRMVFGGVRARGTLASPAAASSGDYTFSLLASAFDGDALRTTAGISMIVDGTVSSGTVPQRIVFETGTTTSRSERLRINATGEVGIGKTATAGVSLDVGGTIAAKTYTVATLPSASALAGQRGYVSDAIQSHAAGIGAVVSGGGSNFVPVYSSGSNWIIG